MSKIIVNTVFVLIVVIVFVVLGNMMFLLNLKQELTKTESELVAKKQDIESIKTFTENTATSSQKINENVVLSLGQEGQLMKFFINEKLENHFKVKTYDLYSNYRYKPEKNDNTNSIESSNNSGNTNNNSNENLQKLEVGEDGMPLNAYSETDSEEWEGLNIFPIKMTFSITKAHMITILKYIQQLPVNTVRSADFIINNDKIISGNLVLAFPINDYK